MEKVLQTKTINENLVTDFASIFFGSLVLFFAANVKIPFYPISFTGHTLVIFVIALTQKPRYALFSTLLYLGYESLHSSLWLFSKSGGYLLSFPIAAYVIAKLSRKISAFSAVAFGQIIIYVAGFSWLSFFIGYELALSYGVLIFIPSAVLKNYLAQIISNWIKDKRVL